MQFHPKLWLCRSESELTVLSGSGNLTQGGLEDSAEQFELTKMPLDSEILENDEPYLTVEALVVNERKPYHRFFAEKTKELAAQRLGKFPSWRDSQRASVLQQPGDGLS